MYLGIDVGKTGAIGVLHSHGEYMHVRDLPIQPFRLGKKTKPQWRLMPVLMRDLVQRLDATDEIFLEAVHAQPLNGSVGGFALGRLFGAIEAILESQCAAATTQISPQVWKRHFNLIGKDKDASRLLALELFPEAKEQLKRKMDHNRSEALLIARYGWETRG